MYLPLLLHSSLPDSTMLFGALVLGAALLMTRVLRDPRGPACWTPASSGSACSSALAALTRNEAVWLALTWAWLAWRVRGPLAGVRVRLIGIVAVVSLIVFAPWALRDWVVFGNPLPGQAASNALSLSGFDIFAWNHPPTLARYLAAGPGAPARDARHGIGHNLFNVLLLLGVPMSLLGLVALPWQGRDRALRPVLLVAVLDVPRHQPAVPGGDDVGHVPPRRDAGRGAADRVRARRARRGHREARPPTGLDAAGRVAGPAARRSSRRRCSRSCSCPASAAARVPRPRTYQVLARADGGHRGSARRQRPRDPRLPDLARGDRARAHPRAARRDPVGRPRPRDPLRRASG